jgi:hypothetical protein
MKTLHLTTLAVVSAAATSSSVFARPTVDANLAEMYRVTEADPTDVSTRLRLAGYLQSIGLVAEGNAILKELAASGADVDLIVDAGEIADCPECRGGSNGPDVIVGDLNGMTNWGKIEVSPDVWYYSFSTGTTSCNIGNQQLEWFASQNRHPVIGQTIYRIHNNVLRMLGQGWLKHGFFALSQNLCSGGGCQSTNGSWLGIDCSDPYTSGRNGDQGNLGPKYQIRAASGYYPYPPASGTGVSSSLSRRIQVRLSDLNPANWANAIYFTEGTYVQWQDSQFENDNNSTSWRRFGFTYNAGANPNTPDDDTVSTPSFFVNGQTQTTQRMKTPIDAWKTFVPAVQIAEVTIPSDSNIQLNGTAGATYWSGRMQVGSYVADNMDGTWTYHYALYNQNSDRSAQSFTVEVPAAVTVTNPGFADVDYHSGDGNGNQNFSGTDWTYSNNRGVGEVSWSTQSFNVNQSANAVRWGTTYTFQFTADAAPDAVSATVGLFRPGPDANPIITVQGPGCLLAWDLDDDGDVGFSDLNLLLDEYGKTYDFEDLNNLLGQYGQSCN